VLCWAVMPGGPRILEVGQFALFARAWPDRTRCLWTGHRPSDVEGVPHEPFALRHVRVVLRALRAGAFDLVVSNLGVNNFDDAPGALRECHRVLGAGGILGLSSNLVGHMRELYAAFERVLVAAGDRLALERLRRHVGHRATVASLRASLESAGFRVTAAREREAVLRFASSGALFAHHFIRLGFRPAWEEIAGPAALAALRAELDRVASAEGALRLSIPLACLEARREDRGPR